MTKSTHPTFTFRLQPDTLASLDRLRRNEPDPPSRGRMLCILVERAASINDDQAQVRRAVSTPAKSANQADRAAASKRSIRTALEKFLNPQEATMAKTPAKPSKAATKTDAKQDKKMGVKDGPAKGKGKSAKGC